MASAASIARPANQVLPYIPSTIPKASAFRSEMAAATSEIAELTEISSDHQLSLTRQRPPLLPPPQPNDSCLTKRRNEWVVAKFKTLNHSQHPVVQFLDTMETRVVAKHHIAYVNPPSWFMNLKDPVVAPFPQRDGSLLWCSAFVAEQPSVR